MIAAEFIALVALLFGGGIGLSAVVSWIRRADANAHEDQRQVAQMREDLRSALRSRDYRRLDDFMVMWSDRIDPAARKHLELRRDELYIEADDRRTNEQR